MPPADNAEDEMNNLFKVVRKCAEDTVVFKPSVQRPDFYIVVGLSEERKRLISFSQLFRLFKVLDTHQLFNVKGFIIDVVVLKIDMFLINDNNI